MCPPPIDASALVKLLIAEPESSAVAELLSSATVITSELAAVELACTARRRDLPRAMPHIEAILALERQHQEPTLWRQDARTRHGRRAPLAPSRASRVQKWSCA